MDIENKVMAVKIFPVILLLFLALLGCTQLRQSQKTHSLDMVLCPCKLYDTYIGADSCFLQTEVVEADRIVSVLSLNQSLLAEFVVGRNDTIPSRVSVYNEAGELVRRYSNVTHEDFSIRRMYNRDFAHTLTVFDQDYATNLTLEFGEEGFPISLYTLDESQKLKGWISSWHDNGKLYSHECVSCGKETYLVFHENGEIALKATSWNSSLFFVGKYTEYYDNGQIMVTGEWNNPETREISKLGKIGVWIEYDSLGMEVSRFDYGQIDK